MAADAKLHHLQYCIACTSPAAVDAGLSASFCSSFYF
jgi:hypothetical protein